MSECHGFFEDYPGGGEFVCGAAGSEECEFECPYRRYLGLTLKQIEKRELEEME